MIPAGIYLLKVILCSALLSGYYFLALRNKVFHQWNRFFLLATVLLSLILPLMRFTIFHTTEEVDQGAINLLNVVGGAGEAEVIVTGANQFSLLHWAPYLYICCSLALLVALIATLIKIARIIWQHEAQEIENILFINTEVKSTPFSFFKYIFWNRSIDINSQAGSQIFKHELVHVREWHTLDKLIMQVVLVLFWCNPFFWLIRHELQMIHEFIADKKTVQEQSVSQLAALILTTVYPKHFAHIVNPFFHQTIKRRLFMLTQIQSPRMSYASRLFILPLLGVAVLAFSVKTKTIASPGVTATATKKITVMVDAGHGGNDGGAWSTDLFEKGLTLAIAKEIKALNENENIDIVLTRSDDATMPLQNRIDMLQKQHADLLLSIHVNATDATSTAAENKQSQQSSGFEILVQQETSLHGSQSRLLGSALVQSIGSIYKTSDVLNQALRVYLLKQTICPAVLIECGYLTDDADRNFIKQPQNQKAIAKRILAGVERFRAAKVGAATEGTGNTSVSQGKDEAVKSLNVKMVGDAYPDAIMKTISSPKNSQNAAAGEAVNNAPVIQQKADTAGPVVFVDGIIFKGNTNTLDPNSIHTINVWKGDSARIKFGALGVNGVMEIITRKSDQAKKPIAYLDGKLYEGDVNKLDPNSIFSINVLKGESARAKYGVSGTYGIIEITSRKPGDQGKPTSRVNISSDNQSDEPTFTKVEVEAGFPGGVASWRKFLTTNLYEKIAATNGAPKGTFTVVVQFIVEKDGSIHDIKSLTSHGYGMEEEVMRVIKSGPKWTPATQNKKAVRAYRKQPISFVVS
ncbi:MAG: N-acetylmuramoyl-L-alanine amidase [Chitinophagaceae bacterium]